MGKYWLSKAVLGFLTKLLLCNSSANCVKAQGTPGEPLFLTPLIKDGNIEEAQNLSLVKGFYPEITSYSGFITVNEEYNSNMFFWFFPASPDAPVILWSDGGPGVSGVFSIFGQNGPFLVDWNKTISLNEHSWHFTHNIIYLDNPVGVGFSFTEDDLGNINSGDGAVPNIYEFLTQFFKLFPHLQTNEFYNGGASYGGTYASHIAHHIHTKNQDNPEILINLKGLIVDSPWIDPVTQIEYGAYLFNVGLIDEQTRLEFDTNRDLMRELIAQEKFVEAFEVWRTQAYTDVVNSVGYTALNHILRLEYLDTDVTDLIVQNSTRLSLHVGNLSYLWHSVEVQSRMQPNFMRSAKPSLEVILKAGYKTMIYIGNLDGLTGHLGFQNLIKNLDWEGATELLQSTRSIWRVDEAIAGYAKTAKNATLIVMRNAGHGCNADQPAWALDLVNRFTKGLPF